MAHYPRACHPLNGKRQAADCLCSVCNLFTWEGTVPRQHLVSSMFLGSHPGSRPIWLRGDQGYRVGGLEEEPLVLGLIFPAPASLGCGSPLGMPVFHLPRAWLRKTTEPSLRAPQDPPRASARVGPGLREHRANWSQIWPAPEHKRLGICSGALSSHCP